MKLINYKKKYSAFVHPDDYDCLRTEMSKDFFAEGSYNGKLELLDCIIRSLLDSLNYHLDTWNLEGFHKNCGDVEYWGNVFEQLDGAKLESFKSEFWGTSIEYILRTTKVLISSTDISDFQVSNQINLADKEYYQYLRSFLKKLKSSDSLYQKVEDKSNSVYFDFGKFSDVYKQLIDNEKRLSKEKEIDIPDLFMRYHLCLSLAKFDEAIEFVREIFQHKDLNSDWKLIDYVQAVSVIKANNVRNETVVEKVRRLILDSNDESFEILPMTDIALKLVTSVKLNDDGKHDKAFELLDSISEESSMRFFSRKDLLHEKYYSLVSMGQYSEAIKLLNNMLEQSITCTDKATICAELAICYSHISQFDDSKKWAVEAFERDWQIIYNDNLVGMLLFVSDEQQDSTVFDPYFVHFRAKASNVKDLQILDQIIQAIARQKDLVRQKKWTGILIRKFPFALTTVKNLVMYIFISFLFLIGYHKN